MSTRSTTHFVERDRVAAIVYRHSDGYPEAAGADLLDFFAQVKEQTQDTRFYDPTYLAAKYVVFLAGMFALSATYGPDADGKWAEHPENVKPLNFISVGVMLEDPGNIEFRYLVHCDKQVDGRPEVTVQEVRFSDKGAKNLGEVAEVLKQPVAD